MQKIFLNFSKFVGFQGLFRKTSRFGKWANLKLVNILNETFRRASSLRFIKNGGIVDEHGPRLMPAMPIFQKHCFFKKRPKNQKILKIPRNVFAFLVAFLQGFLWYLVCFHNVIGCRKTEGNVFAVKSHPHTTVY